MYLRNTDAKLNPVSTKVTSLEIDLFSLEIIDGITGNSYSSTRLNIIKQSFFTLSASPVQMTFNGLLSSCVDAINQPREHICFLDCHQSITVQAFSVNQAISNIFRIQDFFVLVGFHDLL